MERELLSISSPQSEQDWQDFSTATGFEELLNEVEMVLENWKINELVNDDRGKGMIMLTSEEVHFRKNAFVLELRLKPNNLSIRKDAMMQLAHLNQTSFEMLNT